MASHSWLYQVSQGCLTLELITSFEGLLEEACITFFIFLKCTNKVNLFEMIFVLPLTPTLIGMTTNVIRAWFFNFSSQKLYNVTIFIFFCITMFLIWKHVVWFGLNQMKIKYSKTFIQTLWCYKYFYFLGEFWNI